MTIDPLMKVAPAIVLLALLAPGAAFAAEPAMVTQIGGKSVSWQHGMKSSAAKIQTLLNAGDRVTADAGSFADVTYLEDNCTVRVSGGESVVIGANSPCATKTAKKSDTIGEDRNTGADAVAMASEAKIIPAASEQVTASVGNKTGGFTRLNRGDGLADANVGDNLKVGDEVFAGPDSSITLYFSVPNCEYTVPAGNVYTIPAQPPCKAPGAPNDSGSTAATTSAATGINTGVVVAGVVAAGAIGGAVVLLNEGNQGDNNGNPATPP